VFHCALYRSLLVKMPACSTLISRRERLHPPSTRVSSCPFWLWSVLVVCSSVGPQRTKRYLVPAGTKNLCLPARQRAFVSGSRKKFFYDQCRGRNPPWQGGGVLCGGDT